MPEGLGKGFGLGFEGQEGQVTDRHGREQGIHTGFCLCG